MRDINVEDWLLMVKAIIEHAKAIQAQTKAIRQNTEAINRNTINS